MSEDSMPDAELSAEVVAVSDGAYTLIAADFDDTQAAWDAYELLKSIEDGRHVEIERHRRQARRRRHDRGPEDH